MFHDLFDFDRKKNKLGSNNLIKYLKLFFFDFHQISFTASQSKAQWAWREFPNEGLSSPEPNYKFEGKIFVYADKTRIPVWNWFSQPAHAINKMQIKFDVMNGKHFSSKSLPIRFLLR